MTRHADRSGPVASAVLHCLLRRGRIALSTLLLATSGLCAQEPPPELVAPPVAFSLAGRITDDTGAPVTDAEVWVVPAVGGAVRRVKADENGQYAIGAVRAAEDYSIDIYSKMAVAHPSWQRHVVPLSPVAERIHDIQLQRACQVLLRLVDEQGQPLPKVEVFLNPAAIRHLQGPNRTLTDENGFALLGGVPPSEADYLIAVDDARYPLSCELLQLRDPTSTVYREMTVKKGTEVSGRALLADGSPAAKVELLVAPSWGHSLVGPRTITTREDGTFTIPQVLPGRYDVQARVPTDDRKFSTDATLHKDFDLIAAHDLTFQLPRSPLTATEMIVGRVEYVGQPPRGGFALAAQPLVGGLRHVTYIQRGDTQFQIGPVPPGEVRLSTTSTEIELNVQVVTAPAADVVLRVSRKVRPDLTVAIVDDESGEPVRDFRVAVQKFNLASGLRDAENDNWRSPSGEAGQFGTQVSGVGNYRLLVVAPGYAPLYSEPIKLDPQQESPATLRLKRGTTVRGRIVNEAGAAVTGASVVVAYPITEQLRFPLRLGEADRSELPDSEFEIPDLPDAQVRLRVTHPDYAPLELNLDPRPAAEDRVEFVLPTGGQLRGTVFAADGGAGANVVLTISRRRSDDAYIVKVPFEITAVTAPDGAYRVDRLAPGDYTVERRRAERGEIIQSQRVQIENRTAHTLNFDPPPAP